MRGAQQRSAAEAEAPAAKGRGGGDQEMVVASAGDAMAILVTHRDIIP